MTLTRELTSSGEYTLGLQSKQEVNESEHPQTQPHTGFHNGKIQQQDDASIHVTATRVDLATAVTRESNIPTITTIVWIKRRHIITHIAIPDIRTTYMDRKELK